MGVASKFLWRLFYLFCFLAGQYINFEIIKKPSGSPSRLPESPSRSLESSDSSESPSRSLESSDSSESPSRSLEPPSESPSESPSGFSCKKLVSVIALIPFVGQVIVYFGYVGTALAVEVCTIANINCTNSTGNGSSICMLPQEHWKFTTAITISTIAAFFSYSLMTFFVLIPVNSIRCCSSKCCYSNGCCTTYGKALRDSALSPYNDDDKSSELSAEQTCYFFTNYLFVILLFLCSFVSSFIYVRSVYNQGSCRVNGLYLAMIVLHLSSQFCAVHSCFIFSKIIYKVTNLLQKLAIDMNQVNFQEQRKTTAAREIENDKELKELVEVEDNKNVDRGRYHWLLKIDQDFIKQVKPVLELFGLWFIFHWTLYALTTVLLSAFIIQIIIEVLQFKSVDRFLPNGEAAPYVLYVVFFTLVHAYLFLYPCFRAAAIGSARAKMICKISEKRWLNIPISIQISFIQYLTSKNFTFQVPLFCASVPIGFNWIFVSFFVPVLGAYLSF